MVIATSLLGLLPGPAARAITPADFFFAEPVSTAWSALVAALGAMAGGYVARQRFAIVAVAFHVFVLLILVRILQSIAEPAQPTSYLEILARNSIGIGVTLLAVYLGACAGASLSDGPEDAWLLRPDEPTVPTWRVMCAWSTPFSARKTSANGMRRMQALAGRQTKALGSPALPGRSDNGRNPSARELLEAERIQRLHPEQQRGHPRAVPADPGKLGHINTYGSLPDYYLDQPFYLPSLRQSRDLEGALAKVVLRGGKRSHRRQGGRVSPMPQTQAGLLRRLATFCNQYARLAGR